MEGAGAATGCGLHPNCPLTTTISGYTSATTVTLTAAATSTAPSGGTYVQWGTDNTAAIQAAIDLAAYPNLNEYAVYFPHATNSAINQRGCYAITSAIKLPNSTASANKFLILYGDGFLASSICQYTWGQPAISDTFVHLAGTGEIIKQLGIIGQPDYADSNGAGIECAYCIGILIDHDWFAGWQYGLKMDQVSGQSGAGLYFTNNICEESVTCVYWHGTDALPVSGIALITGNQFDFMYNYTGAVLDFSYVTGIQEGYNIYGPNIGQGIKCDHCTSFNFGNDDFASQSVGTSQQNIDLTNSTNGDIHDMRFNNDYPSIPLVYLRGGNTDITFHNNSYRTTSTGYAQAWYGTGNSVVVEHETVISATSPAFYINSFSAMGAGARITDINYDPSVPTPYIASFLNPAPAGTNISMTSNSVAANDLITGTVNGVVNAGVHATTTAGGSDIGAMASAAFTACAAAIVPCSSRQVPGRLALRLPTRR